ncbi:MAG: SIS domain-containing protein [Acidimicrobiales bacterium]
MCGIIAVVRKRSKRPRPAASDLVPVIEQAHESLAGLVAIDAAAPLAAVAHDLEAADRLLRGTPGLQFLLAEPGASDLIRAGLAKLAVDLERFEIELDQHASVDSIDLETVNAALIRVRDASWSLERDRLRAATVVVDLGGPSMRSGAIEAIFSVHQALSALDRMEVRGRDSAGLHLLVSDHALDLTDPAIRAEIASRNEATDLFTNAAVREVDGRLSFVYKVAAEIGELGDNTASLRASIRNDSLLHRALANDEAETVVLGHTRWASIGIISEPNAHPVNSDQADGSDHAYCTAVLNGDVDNYGDLIRAEDLNIADSITTDAKVIPTLTSKHLDDGHDMTEAFRRAVSVFEGSVAIGLSSADAPNDLLLALRGSGQSVYVGLAEDSFIVASEPYGVVEETSTYLRMDGETPANLDNPNASRGQILRVRGELAGTIEGIERVAYDGTDLPVTDDDLAVAEVTTRDIDRGDQPHYLLKEITEAPRSFRKTLRGKLVERDGLFGVTLASSTIPEEIAQMLRSRKITTVQVIGQGTAAIAGQAVASAIQAEIDGELNVSAIPATELSGFGLRKDMSDTLVVAISQSGTTTDTNRTVDLVKQRGARVIAIVNRRGSDLTDRADGVLYTSDGRDVEMSVASTKAFYSQIAAGFLLAVGLADLVLGDRAETEERQTMLSSIRDLPAAMEVCLGRRADVARAASTHAPSRRYWACVGNGPNLIAARELRIKLSELCYKSMSADSTEDKKHIDLSSEPMILVCAAGLEGSTADDVGKEVAIFRAHKSAPIVIANEGETRFGAALDVIYVPVVHRRLAFVLSTMIGHLFGYEAALAIDAQARPLRESRAVIESLIDETRGALSGEEFLGRIEPSLAPVASQFIDGVRVGSYNGHLEAGTAVDLAARFRYALGTVPLDTYQLEFGKVGTPSVVIEDLITSLTAAIDELTRPIDAIKHQAKTVTVGISRTDETLLEFPLVRSVLDAGTPRDRLSYGTIRTLANLDPAVADVTGWTRYSIDGVDDTNGGTITVVDRGGISTTIPSRTDRSPVLRGTKKRVAEEREVLVARGRSDGRAIVMVPEVKDNETTGMTLLHIELPDHLTPEVMRGVLQGYRNRFSALHGAVTETEETFRVDRLREESVGDLLWVSIQELADRWRS